MGAGRCFYRLLWPPLVVGAFGLAALGVEGPRWDMQPGSKGSQDVLPH